MYAMRTPEEVLERLGKYGTTHILVENSICYQGGRKEDNCATPDLLDLANNHLESDRTTKKVPNRNPRTEKSVCAMTKLKIMIRIVFQLVKNLSLILLDQII